MWISEGEGEGGSEGECKGKGRVDGDEVCEGRGREGRGRVSVWVNVRWGIELGSTLSLRIILSASEQPQR